MLAFWLEHVTDDITSSLETSWHTVFAPVYEFHCSSILVYGWNGFLKWFLRNLTEGILNSQ